MAKAFGTFSVSPHFSLFVSNF